MERAVSGDQGGRETDFIPVILLTARADPADGCRVTGAGRRHLTKPFDVRELITRIENLIAIRRRLRERFAGSVAAPARALHPSPVAAEPADQKFLDQVRAAIEARLGDDAFSVERLAQDVAHSRGHLHRRLTSSESPYE